MNSASAACFGAWDSEVFEGMAAEVVFWISTLLVIYTYVGYPLVLKILLFFAPSRDYKKQESLPFVSIVISVYNEEKGILEKIQNLKEIAYPRGRLEILVGSDGSTDGTVDLLQANRLEVMKVLVFPRRRGKAAVLNDLVKEARGELIAFSDANSLFRVDTLENLVKPFSEPHVGAVSGELLLTSSGNVGESVYWQYETMVKRLEGRAGTLVGATGGVYAIRRSLYRPLPLDRAVADDFVIPMMILQQGYRVEYAPEAVAFETAEKTVRREFRRKVRIGAQNFNALRYVRSSLNPRRGFAAFALWSHKIIRWSVPFALLALGAATAALYRPGGALAPVFYAEVAFVALALAGWVGERWNVRTPMVILPYYFLAVNAALIVGFLKSIAGRQSLFWEVDR